MKYNRFHRWWHQQHRRQWQWQRRKAKWKYHSDSSRLNWHRYCIITVPLLWLWPFIISNNAFRINFPLFSRAITARNRRTYSVAAISLSDHVFPVCMCSEHDSFWIKQQQIHTTKRKCIDTTINTRTQTQDNNNNNKNNETQNKYTANKWTFHTKKQTKWWKCKVMCTDLK